MATCSYCQQRKGKRSCPALGGAICSQCCGQHRLQDIVCPSDCMYLGGLAVIGDPALAAAGFTPAEYQTAWEKLHAYAEGVSAFRQDALARCFEPPDKPEQWDTDVAVGYLYYGHCDAGRRRLVDHFLAIRGRGLSPGEAAAMLAIQRAWASLFEIAAVHAGTGLELRDLLSGETVRVHDVSASGQLKKWDVLFTWLMPAHGHIEMTGAGCLVPRKHLDRVRTAIDAELANTRRARPGIGDRELVGSIAWVVVRTLRDARRDVQMPMLHTTDGEELVACVAHYAIEDEAAVRAGLAGIAELEPEGSAYRWSRPDAAATVPSSTTLGRVRLSDRDLVLETMSRERSARGKQLLEGALGALISHREDAFETYDAAVARRGKPSVHAPDHVPDDEELEAVGQYLQDHYRRWLDTPLPALDGKTPRDAARTDHGRAQVEELLKDIENTSLAIPGGEAVDFDALRRELAIAPDTDDDDELDDDELDDDELDDDGPDDDDDEPDRETGRALVYDAELAPDAATWLEVDDSVKTRAVQHHHRSLDTHGAMPSAHAHALMHVIVENQLAGSESPEARATLARLSGAGVARHDAIHAIGSVVAEAIFDVLKHKTAYDREATVRALDALDPEHWRAAPPR